MSENTRWWHREKDKIVCDLCPRRCRLGEGARGFCFVRQNQGGEMVLTTYGKSTGFCIDPIEKKPLNHFLPGTPILSFGTAGCNLGCKFCQNWDISKSKEIASLSAEASPEQIVKAAKNSGCRSIAFTYNDPVIWAEYAIDTAIVAHEQDIKTVAVSAGYITDEARADFYEHIDAVNVDLKAFSQEFYKHLTLSKLDPVLDTLKWLKHESDVWFEITNLIIPGENDSEAEIRRMSEWILKHLGDDVPIHFTAFHPDYKMMNKPRTPHETLNSARTWAFEAGIRFAYVGNVLDTERQSTYCPKCHELLIGRDHYELGVWSIKKGCCESCGEKIPGVFEAERGNWGRRREPLDVEEFQDAVRIDFSQLTKGASAQLSTAQEGVDEAVDAVNDMADRVGTESSQLRPMPEVEPNVEFTREQAEAMLHYARAIVSSAVLKAPLKVALKPELASTQSYGIFVTLKRGAMLRACRGQWGDLNTQTLGALLQGAAASASTVDPRFPSITPSELPMLTIELSLMFNPKRIEAQGEARAEAVKVGTHGLVIAHPNGRGLLLPQVATENGWDSLHFLQRVCAKAGLPPETWKDPAAELMTFEGKIVAARPNVQEFDPVQLKPPVREQILHAANALVGFSKERVRLNPAYGATRNAQMGLHIEDAAGHNATTFIHSGSVLDLVKRALAALAEHTASQSEKLQPIVRTTLLTQPISLSPKEYPQRHGTLLHSAIYGEHDGQRTLMLPGADKPPDKMAGVLNALSLTADQWQDSGAVLTAYQAFTVQAQFQQPQTQTPPAAQASVRPAVCPGSFYPSTPAEIDKVLSTLLTLGSEQEKEAYRAIMLPHAGWRFCGDIIARTLNRCQLPTLAVIIGPKHTPKGPTWSVSSHDAWAMPQGHQVIASRYAELMAKVIGPLEREPEAHASEHGTEVLLPFLNRLKPDMRVAPVTIGNSSYDQLDLFSNGLAHLIQQTKLLPLFIISSDMNHFAEESENRRLDKMALEAMQTGDPKLLYDICTQNKISMCGMQAAVVVMQTLQKLSGKLSVEYTGYETSSRVTKDPSRVVGYAGAVIR